MKKVTGIDLKPLDTFVKGIDKGIKTPSFGSPIGKMFKRIGTVYLAFIRKRFVAFSSGAGNWKPIEERGRDKRANAKREAKGKKRKGSKILRDTGVLLGALSIGAAGNLFKRIKGGVRVGFSDSVQHDDETDATIRDIAVYHDEGTDIIPQREILAEPSPNAEKKFKEIIKDGITEMGKLAERSIK